MNAVPLLFSANVETEEPPRATMGSGRSSEPSRICNHAKRREVETCVLLQLAMCGAFINRDAIEFARGIAEILCWSAEHARLSALIKDGEPVPETAEWHCRKCGELVPETFDLCWNCETDF